MSEPKVPHVRQVERKIIGLRGRRESNEDDRLAWPKGVMAGDGDMTPPRGTQPYVGTPRWVKVGLRGQKTIGAGKVDSVTEARDIPADHAQAVFPIIDYA
jgi:hypothetical protein